MSGQRGQRGLGLWETGLALTLGLATVSIALTGINASRQRADSTAAVLSVREVLRQASATYGAGRNGYPGGTAVTTELVRAGRLPASLESTAAGVFAVAGVGTLTYTVPVAAGMSTGTEQQLTATFPLGSDAGGSPCRAYARSLRGWAIRIAASDATPYDNDGQLLGEAAYEAFWASRCQADGAQVIGWFR